MRRMLKRSSANLEVSIYRRQPSPSSQALAMWSLSMSVSVSLTSRLAWLLGALVLSLVWIRTWTRRLHNALLDLLNKVAHEET